MVSLLPTKFHEILFSSFRGVALTNCVTDRTKTICLPTKVGEGDIILQILWKKGNNCTMGNQIYFNIAGYVDLDMLNIFAI
jgi:hypothetical protein